MARERILISGKTSRRPVPFGCSHSSLFFSFGLFAIQRRRSATARHQCPCLHGHQAFISRKHKVKMIGIELLLCYLLLFLAAGADCLFRAPALDPAFVKPKNPLGIDILRDSLSLSAPLYRAGYEGIATIGSTSMMGGITNFIEKRFGMNCFEATFVGRGLFWTRAFILAFAFVATGAIDLVLALFLPHAGNKLVVASFWNIVAFVRTIGIWFRKRRRKPPDKLQSNAIRPNLSQPVFDWSLLSIYNDVKRGRQAGQDDLHSAFATIKSAV